jgi:hypothetical protein
VCVCVSFSVVGTATRHLFFVLSLSCSHSSHCWCEGGGGGCLQSKCTRCCVKLSTLCAPVMVVIHCVHCHSSHTVNNIVTAAVHTCHLTYFISVILGSVCKTCLAPIHAVFCRPYLAWVSSVLFILRAISLAMKFLLTFLEGCLNIPGLNSL